MTTLTLVSNEEFKVTKGKEKEKSTLPAGTTFIISPNPESDTRARVTIAHDGLDRPINTNISYRSLSLWFPSEFPELTEDDMANELTDGEYISVRGNTCYEPDGHDEEGWPCKLLALGYV